jgi:hypothetical protein
MEAEYEILQFAYNISSVFGSASLHAIDAISLVFNSQETEF